MIKQNITLIGMAGVGKSTVGAVLANKLCWQLIDIDVLLEEDHGKTLQEILEEVGETNLIRLESDKVKERILYERQVITPGGSIVYSDEAMQALKKVSFVIYLAAESAFIEKRIDVKSRGIVGLKDNNFNTLYTEREKLYKKYAEIIVDVENKSPEQIAEEILSLQQVST